MRTIILLMILSLCFAASQAQQNVNSNIVGNWRVIGFMNNNQMMPLDSGANINAALYQQAQAKAAKKGRSLDKMDSSFVQMQALMIMRLKSTTIQFRPNQTYTLTITNDQPPTIGSGSWALNKATSILQLNESRNGKAASPLFGKMWLKKDQLMGQLGDIDKEVYIFSK